MQSQIGRFKRLISQNRMTRPIWTNQMSETADLKSDILPTLSGLKSDEDVRLCQIWDWTSQTSDFKKRGKL